MEQSKINNFLETHTQWRQVDGSLTAMWSIDSFESVAAHISQLCDVFSEMNHHPTVTFGYNFIRIETTTHDAGNVVTDKDIMLAEKITAVLGE